MRWLVAFAVAVLNDVVDILGAGAVPVAGDLLDVAATAVLVPLVGGPKPLVTATELIPGSDFLPIFTLVTLWAYLRR